MEMCTVSTHRNSFHNPSTVTNFILTYKKPKHGISVTYLLKSTKNSRKKHWLLWNHMTSNVLELICWQFAQWRCLHHVFAYCRWLAITFLTVYLMFKHNKGQEKPERKLLTTIIQIYTSNSFIRYLRHTQSKLRFALLWQLGSQTLL